MSSTEVPRRVITSAKTTPERKWLGTVASVALVPSVRDTHRAYQTRFDSPTQPDGHHYASLVVEAEPTPLPPVEREAGMDLGVARLATVSDTAGHRVDVVNQKHLARTPRTLRRLEREKTRSGANRAMTRRQVAVRHGEVTRVR